MKTFRNSYILTAALLTFYSCSDDDTTALVTENPENIELVATGFSSTILENPQQGDILGEVQVNVTEGTVFSFSSSDPDGAIAINNSGEVLVNDPLQFDFETRTSISGTVLLTNGEAQTTADVDISISDADDLETLLTTSRDDFIAANGSWVEVTEDEYNLLAQAIVGTQRVGVPEEAFNPNQDILQTAGDIMISNTIDVPMPSGSYLYAFKYYSTSGSNGNNNGQVRPKVSEESPTTGFIGRGPLPAHESGFRYFVDAVSFATASQGYLAMYSPYSLGWIENNQSSMRYRFGNGSDMTNTFADVQVLFQGLVTDQKQWN